MGIEVYKQFTDRVQQTSIDLNVRLPFAENINAYKQWKDELPILDTYACACSLSSVSQALLSPQINCSTKLALINEAQSFLNTLLSSGKEKLKGSNLPLPRQQMNLSNELIKVISLFSDVYIQLIDVINTQRINAAQLAIPTEQLIFKAIELLAKKQLIMSLVYQSPQADFWNTVNALYRLAEGLNVQQKEQQPFDKTYTSSIESEFKTIHLFNLASVNRFRRGDINRVQRILTLQTNNITISSTHEDTSTFSIDLASCSALQFSPLSQNGTDTTRYINTEQLVKFMLSDEVTAHEQHGAVSLISDKPRLTKKVIHQLIPNWSVQPSRQSNRHPQHEDVLVYPGFDSIIKAIMPTTSSETEKKDQPNKTTFGLPGVTLTPIDSSQYHNHIVRSENVINTSLQRTAEVAISSEDIWATNNEHKAAEKGNQMSAKVNDTSLQGLQFKVLPNNKPLLRVTDLIGIQTKTEALQLAIIRRLNKFKNGEVSVGVEMISPHLKIASLRTLEKGDDTKPVIFLQGIPSINQADSIICSFMIENNNTEVSLNVNNKTSLFTIGQTLETNRVFSHYTVLKKQK